MRPTKPTTFIYETPVQSKLNDFSKDHKEVLIKKLRGLDKNDFIVKINCPFGRQKLIKKAIEIGNIFQEAGIIVGQCGSANIVESSEYAVKIRYHPENKKNADKINKILNDVFIGKFKMEDSEPEEKTIRIYISGYLGKEPQFTNEGIVVF